MCSLQKRGDSIKYEVHYIFPEYTEPDSWEAIESMLSRMSTPFFPSEHQIQDRFTIILPNGNEYALPVIVKRPKLVEEDSIIYNSPFTTVIEHYIEGKKLETFVHFKPSEEYNYITTIEVIEGDTHVD